MIRTAVVGASGFLGRHLWRSYPGCLGTSFSRPTPGLVPFDLRRPEAALLRLEEHDAVLIASARPLIGDCEAHPADSRALNVDGTLELARQVAAAGRQVIFLSSDYVFAGQGRYDDAASREPSTEYGRQKLAVEQGLPPGSLVVRLSKVYGLERDGTLLHELADALRAGQKVRTAHDQVFCPTLVDDVVRAVHDLQHAGATGLVNVCAPGRWSRDGIARALAAALGRGEVETISLHDLPGMANRPLDTSMICRRLPEFSDVQFTPLERAIEQVARA